jgi:hypothetical protein
MSEDRRPVYIVTFKTGKKRNHTIEIFKKSQWTGDQSDDIYYRLRIDRVWHGGGWNDKMFINRDGVMAIIQQTLARGGVV